MVFSVLGGRFAGPSVLVHVPTLVRRVRELPRYIDTVVFVDEPVPDGALVATVDDMVAAFGSADLDVLAQYVPATEAVKRVDGMVVAEGIDRSSLVAVRCPEVIRRSTLEKAVSEVGEQMWVNPAALVVASGGKIGFYEGPRAAIRRPGVG